MKPSIHARVGLALLATSCALPTDEVEPVADVVPAGGAVQAEAVDEGPEASDALERLDARLEALQKRLNEAKRQKVETARLAGYAEAELEIAHLDVRSADVEATEAMRAARAALVAARDEVVRNERSMRDRESTDPGATAAILRNLSDAVRGAEADLAVAEIAGERARRVAELREDQRRDEADAATRAAKAAAKRVDSLQKQFDQVRKERDRLRQAAEAPTGSNDADERAMRGGER